MKTRLLLSWLTGLLAVFSGFSQAQTGALQPADSVLHRVILIGDAGRLRNGKNPVVDAVSARYDLDNIRTTLVYLGDNVYPHGLEDETSPNYDSLTAILGYQAQPGLASPGRASPGLGKRSNVIFIPGNHDWAKGRPAGWERIRRQGQWLDSLHAPNIRLLPADGCPGPEVIPLDSNLVLIVVDTQWWLHPYEKPGVDSDCACKTEDEVLTRLTDLINRNRDKGIILATHQPFRSYGIHGGYYTIKQHLFPLTDINSHLYIPLPIIGSIYPFGRGVIGNIQDLPNQTYKRMVRLFENAVAPAPNVLFVSGHDHALQHIVDGNRNYIVSGSGINRERVKPGKLARFVSGEWGYVVVDHLVGGRVRATFFTVDEGANATPAYATPLFTVPQNPKVGQGASRPERFPDSVRVAAAPSYDNVSRLRRFLLGENYRREWATPVKLPVFSIDRTGGGFTVLQRGGGQQTKSLRLKAADGREWVLRTVQKAPERALPEYLRETVATVILQDAISAAHPYAPLAVPTLAGAIQVPYAKPTVYYVPDDPALGDYRADFGNTVCLLEERNPNGESKTLSTPKVLKELEDDNDNHVDQRAVLRARLLDLWIGDWDRHEDQWRWGSRTSNKSTVFYPIPRDRDQVFFKGEGPLFWIASQSWIQPKFQGFRRKLSNINGFMFNGRYFDRLFLTELSEDDWRKEIESFRQTMTDSLVDRAIRQLPDSIQRLSGAYIRSTLKARREKLMELGMTYYRFLARTVDIPGSDKAEQLAIQHQDRDYITVTIAKLDKNGQPGKLVYQRLFSAADTREIRLYGQGGADQFKVSGPKTQGIKVRLIGGKGKDTFAVDSGQPASTLIYDRSTEENTLPDRHQATLHLAPDAAVNQFDPHAFQYDRLAPLFSIGYNIDDGVLLGAGVQWTTQSFRKLPFATSHRFLVGHALATNATFFRYDAQFTHLIGKNDLLVNAHIKAPDNITNFFGVGNETIYERNRRIRYYRTRYNLFDVAVLLKRQLSEHTQVSAGPIFQYFRLNVGENAGRFIEDYLASLPADKPPFVDEEAYVGYRLNYRIDTRNSTAIPTRGVYWNTSFHQLLAFNNAHTSLTQLQTDFALYTRFSTVARLVMANRIGAGLTYGNPAFYQLQYLGGQDNLRGFRNYRFAGNGLLYHNLDLRIKLFDFASFLFPGSFGLTAFNDVGRVWAKDEKSQRWHHGYGGGIFITPVQRLVLNGSLAFSREGTLVYFSLGYRF